MTFVLLLSLFTVLIISVELTKKKLNYVSIVIIWYMTFLILARYRLPLLYDLSNYTFNYFLLNVLIITFFSIFGRHFTFIKTRKKIKDELDENDISSILIMKIMRYLSLFFGIIILANLGLLIILRGFSLNSLRSIIFDADTYSTLFFSGRIFFIYNYFIKGFSFFDISYSLINYRKDSIRIPMITIINYLIISIVTLGRIEIFRIVMTILIILIVIRSPNRYSSSNKKKSFTGILALIIIVFGAISIIRNESDESLFQYTLSTFTNYFSGSFIAFDQYIQTPFTFDSSISIVNVIFGGLVQFINLFTSFLGFELINHNLVLASYANNGVYIGNDAKYNAFFTMYYNFHSAGGIFVSVLLSALIGLILGISYKKYILRNSSLNAWFTIFILHVIIMGSLRWEFSNFTLWSSLFFAGLVYYFNNVKNKKLSLYG